MAENAIILAAGFGSRLRERSPSKPLTPVCGVPLIEIAVHQAAAAGARRVVVVTGHEAAQVESAIAPLADRFGVEIVPVRLADWSRPNGWSVIAGAQELAGPFLLMMADHVFSDAILPRLAAQRLEGCDVILATDRIDNPLIDPDDATYVALDDATMISRIGKGIAPFDVVDCGAFLANDRLPLAIEAAIAAGRPGSLSDGMQVLADNCRAATMDIGGEWWIDVDDPRAHDLAEAQVADHLRLLRGASPATRRGAMDSVDAC